MRKSACVNVRYLALAFAGGSAFIDMYATQPLLPELRASFGASEAAVAATISTLVFGCALAAPVVGPLADRIGRKRIIVTAIALLGLVTFAAATATSLAALIAWRFVQGLFMPAVFAVTLAYIAEEFPAAVGGRAVGAYIGGNVFGGFLGRWVGALAADRFDWHAAFVALGVMNLIGAGVVFLALPRSRHFVRSASLGETLNAMRTFVRNPVMLATYAIGGSVLFTLVAAFTYATFFLHAPPFSLGTAALGNVFFVYLAGVIATPLSGRLIDRFGHRFTLLLAISVSALGMIVTLAPGLPLVIAGLAIMSTGVFCAQAASQGYIGAIASAQRSTAASLYIMVYYTGGGIGAIAPAGAWHAGGWPATVALILAVQCVSASIAWFVWPRRFG